jgi:hypothetical protein
LTAGVAGDLDGICFRLADDPLGTTAFDMNGVLVGRAVIDRNPLRGNLPLWWI